MDIVKATEKFDEEQRRKGNSPPLVLQQLLITKTKELCAKVKADEKLALVGAYLIDIKIGEALREGKPERHVEMSLQAAKEFFNKFKLPQDFQSKVLNIIQAHHGAVPYDSLEAEIVANADCFKFLHPRGALFFLTDLGEREMTFSEALNYFEQKVEEKRRIISLDVCKKEADKYYKLLRELINLAKRPL